MRTGRILARFVTLGALGLSLALPALGHPNDDMDHLRLVVASWANAVISRDAVTLEALLHDDFQSPSKSAYLAIAAEEVAWPPGRLLLRHAFYKATDEGFEVSPVVLTNEAWIGALTLKLVKVDGKWLLISISPTALPGEVPKHRELHDVRVRLRDATTKGPVAGRVHVVDEAGVYWPPRGHQKNIPLGWRHDVGGDVSVDGKIFAYVEGDFVLPLPPGSYVLEAHRGMEYEPTTVRSPSPVPRSRRSR